jgi:hypothetical protein
VMYDLSFDLRYNATFFKVPGLVEATSSGGIPEHNGFYASFPFNQQQQSSIHLESFSMQNIMRGAPPTPAASRPQTSSSVGMTSFAAASSAADGGVGVGGRGEGEGGGRAAVFNAEPPLNMDDRVCSIVMHVTHHKSHIAHHTSHITHRTSHITHHTSHITHHKSHVTHHTSHITHHTSHITRHTVCAGGGGAG